MVTLNEIQIRLAEALKQSGLTQTEIAHKLGIKQPTVGQYLSGRAMPALDTFANLCAVLDVSSDEILGLKDASGKKININNNNFNINGNGNSFKF